MKSNVERMQNCIICDGASSLFIDQIWDDRYGCPGFFAIRRCNNCGQMLTTPRLREQDLPELYSTYYPRREIDFESLEREADEVLKPFSHLRRWMRGTNNQGHYYARPGQAVLDVGSGSCLSLLELRAMGIEAWGIEADPNVRLIADRYNLRVHIGSIHDRPFGDQKFDLIILNQVIEHVPDPLALLEQVREYLAIDGRLILSFPNVNSLARRLTSSRWINWHVPYHQHHFNLYSFQLLIKKAGFQLTRSKTITPNLWTLLQIRAMGDRPSESQVSTAWSKSKAVGNTHPRLLIRLKRLIITSLSKLLMIFALLGNRLIDLIGRGDSLLVELRRK
jgi:2-polyprenyl-3-methyl-5-hydroxy-6-metoxy-1,4-benzoquinol methylase